MVVLLLRVVPPWYFRSSIRVEYSTTALQGGIFMVVFL
jgi:hypothetical protein